MKLGSIDKLGLGLYFLICLFAVLNISSVDAALGRKQLIFFGISCFFGLVIFLMRSKFFENFAAIFYVAGVLLLVGLFPFGKEILGQKNWYKFGSFTMQPVEFAKIGTALMVANFASQSGFSLKDKRSRLQILAIIGIPAIVVLAIPDVGSLLVFMAFFIALFREGVSGWLFGIGMIFAVIFLVSLAVNPWIMVAIIAGLYLFFIWRQFKQIPWNVLSIAGLIGSFLLLAGLSLGSGFILEKMPHHQRERIEVLYKGEKAFRDTSGYNLLYSKTAIGSGGIWGKGYKQGSVTQGKFVPEQETDYIFCTVGEEWGFAGSVGLILAYALYIGRIYYLAEDQKTAFNRIFGYCFASILLIHFIINIGMVVGLFPTVGIPLPYFSYGGSSLLAFSLMTFIFFKLSYTDRNALV